MPSTNKGRQENYPAIFSSHLIFLKTDQHREREGERLGPSKLTSTFGTRLGPTVSNAITFSGKSISYTEQLRWATVVPFFYCMAHGSPSKIYKRPWMTSVCCFACDICNSYMLYGAHSVPFNAVISSDCGADGKESKQTNPHS